MASASPYVDHQVLHGNVDDKFEFWLMDLKAITKDTGCFDIFFPHLAPEGDLEDEMQRQNEGTWQALAWGLKHRTAVHILSAFISGPVWAYMLTRWPYDDLLQRPDEVVRLAEWASSGCRSAPATQRERNQMLYELDHGDPGQYPSLDHFRAGKEWLERILHGDVAGCPVGVLSSVPVKSEAVLVKSEMVPVKREAVLVKSEMVPVKSEVVNTLSMAEIPNSSARRRRRVICEAERTSEGPEPRRIKVEP